MTSTAPIALTTTFTPPPACTTDTWFIEYVSGTNYHTEVITGSNTSWWLSLGPTETATCYPSGYQASTKTYFSPGICPEVYWNAAQTVITSDGDSETRGTCCSNTRRADGTNAQGISIRWKAADFAAKTTTADVSPTSTTSAFTTPSATNKVTQTSGKGLSTGAKAGIGVGAAACVLLLIAVAIFLCIRRRKNQRPKEQDENIQGNGESLYEMSTDARKPAELGSRHVSLAELQSDQKHRAELDTPGMYGIAELDTGQYPGWSPMDSK
ncbi:hypothetical protein N7488_004726 [Penicillium malachiteum]|nr:hypothetical protein N7488_004726 [Penicillium malachiteum]